jgi:hypothetical protein
VATIPFVFVSIFFSPLGIRFVSVYMV